MEQRANRDAQRGPQARGRGVMAETPTAEEVADLISNEFAGDIHSTTLGLMGAEILILRRILGETARREGSANAELSRLRSQVGGIPAWNDLPSEARSRIVAKADVYAEDGCAGDAAVNVYEEIRSALSKAAPGGTDHG